MTKKIFTPNDAALPMTYPSFVLRTLLREGYPAERLLADTGLSESLFSDPGHQTSFISLSRFFLNAIRVTADPHIGIRLVSNFEPSFMGLPAYAALNAARFEDALQVLHRFFSLTFPAIEFHFPDRMAGLPPGEAAIRLRSRLSLGELSYFAFSSALVGCEVLCRAILRRPHVALRAECVTPEPAGWDRVRGQVPFPVRFDAPENRLIIPAALLQEELLASDPINHRRLVGLCESFAAANGFETTVASRIVVILDGAGGFRLPLSRVAEALGYSERTLRRELSRAGTSFKEVLDDARERRAKEKLATTREPIQRIAYDLGFDSASNFTRSFKRRTGMTPRAYRGTLLAAAEVASE